MRLLHSAAGLCALSAVLAGCSQGSSAPTETMLTMPVSPSAEPTSTGGPTEESLPADPDGDVQGGEVPGGASASEPSEHCVIVAGGVTAAMLAPLSLRSSSDPAELVALEQQILDLRDKVPADLHDDFTTLAYSVEAPPEGSGAFDEKAFRHAMVPVQEWLAQHCTHS